MLRILHRLSTRQQDALRTAVMVVGYLVTAFTPAAFDRWFIRKLAEAVVRFSPERVERLARRMATSLGRCAEWQDLAPSALDQYEMQIESVLGRVRGVHRRGWMPEIRIDGLKELQRSRARGNGTILWRMSFCSTPIVKIAMWRSGIPLVHLSKEEHGARSDAWIARRVLCPLYRRTENWYVTERVVMPWNGSPLPAMRVLIERLRENAVISIFGDNSGSQAVTMPFLDGQAEFAIGAPLLATKVGSTMLPVFVVREGVGQYRVVIDKPIALETGLDRKAKVRMAVLEFSARMQAAIAKYPGSWASWGQFWSRTPPYLTAPSETRAARKPHPPCNC